MGWDAIVDYHMKDEKTDIVKSLEKTITIMEKRLSEIEAKINKNISIDNPKMDK